MHDRCEWQHDRMAADLPIRIVVADDHPVVRGGLVALLRTIAGLDVVGEAADGDSALDGRVGARARRRTDGRTHAGHGRHRGDPTDPGGRT